MDFPELQWTASVSSARTKRALSGLALMKSDGSAHAHERVATSSYL